MNEILLANLFFIITGSAVLVVSVFVCIVCYHIVRIIKQARVMLKRTETSAELLIEDVKVLRDRIVDGSILGKVLAALAGAVMGTTRGRTSSRRKKEGITDI